MMPVFCKDYGLKGIWFAIFHSISAFCNAGFDLMGNEVPYNSLVGYYDDWLVNLVIMSLIIIGGLGFIVWDDHTGINFISGNICYRRSWC